MRSALLCLLSTVGSCAALEANASSPNVQVKLGVNVDLPPASEQTSWRERFLVLQGEVTRQNREIAALRAALAECEKPQKKPSLLMVFHGGGKPHEANDVYEYKLTTRSFSHLIQSDPSSRDEPVELFGKKEVEDESIRELRNFAYSESDRILYITQAYKDNSAILRYDTSNPNLSIFKLGKGSDCIHPYGLALSSENLYVSCQDTNNVVRYATTTLSTTENTTDHKLQGEVVYNTTDPRGVAVSHTTNLLFVAERHKGTVAVLDTRNNKKQTTIDLSGAQTHNDSPTNKTKPQPIGLAVSEGSFVSPRLFVGDKTSGKILVFEMDFWDRSFTQRYILQSVDLTHPAGLSINGRFLYVACQDSKQVMTFDLENLKATAKVVIKTSDLPYDSPEGSPEGILVLDHDVPSMNSYEFTSRIH